MVDIRAFSDEFVKIASFLQGIAHGGGPGALIGGIGGLMADKEDRARGAAYGAGLGLLGGTALGSAATHFPYKKLQNVQFAAEKESRGLLKKIREAAESGNTAKEWDLASAHRRMVEEANAKIRSLTQSVQSAGTLSGIGAGAGGAYYAKHRADQRKKIKTSADLRNLNPEQKEELKQFLKNTGAIVAGTGVGLGLAGLTGVGLDKLFGPKGRWPNMVGPAGRKALSAVGPTVLGGASLYGYHRMRKKDEELMEEARRRGRRQAAAS